MMADNQLRAKKLAEANILQPKPKAALFTPKTYNRGR